MMKRSDQLSMLMIAVLLLLAISTLFQKSAGSAGSYSPKVSNIHFRHI